MSYVVYKLVHLLGVFLTLVALAGMGGFAATGRPKEENPGHRSLLILHGVGVLVALVGGFGLLARIGGGFPGWIWAKLGLWLLLGGLIALPYRKPALARTLVSSSSPSWGFWGPTWPCTSPSERPRPHSFRR